MTNRKSHYSASEAAAAGNIEALRALTAQDASVFHAVDAYRKSLLHLAAEKGRTGMVQFLLNTDKEIRINAPDSQRQTALHLAACNGFADTVDLLLERGANPHLLGICHKTATQQAEGHGHAAIAKRLKEAEATIQDPLSHKPGRLYSGFRWPYDASRGR